MPSSSLRMDSARILLTAASFVIVVAGMKAAAPIVVPFLLSVFIAVLSAPPLFWLERRGAPRLVAMLLVITVIVAAGIGVTVFLGSSLRAFTANLPTYKATLSGYTATVFDWLEAHRVPLTRGHIGDVVDPGQVMQLAADVFNGFGGMLANGFLILFTVIFILLEASSFPAKLARIVSDPLESMTQFKAFMDKLRQYLVIKTWTSLGTGVVVAVWLQVLGVDFAVLWGGLAFMLNYVPNIGSVIAAVPAVLFALVDAGVGAAGWAVVGFLVANVGFGSILEPRLMGRGLGLSTLVVFLSLVFWGWVLGPVGMFLSVPLTMTVRIALESHRDTRWIAVLLGPDPSGHPQSKDVPALAEEN